jgi:DNA-binding NarL/FixJ family response regulator
MIRTGIVAGDLLSMLGVRFLLDKEPGIQVVFAAGELEAIDDHDIECLVLDTRLLPEWHARQASGGQPAVPVVCLADDRVADSAPEIDPAVTEVILRDATPGQLPAAIRRIAISRHTATSTAVALSPREQEVLRHIADGFTHGQAAFRIGISHHTVDTYVKRIRVKLGVGNKAQLVRAALALADAA